MGAVGSDPVCEQGDQSEGFDTLDVLRLSSKKGTQSKGEREVDGGQRTIKLLQSSLCLQIFCNSLIHADVSALILEALGLDTEKYAQWASRQSTVEKLLEFCCTAGACALSDSMGRRIVLFLFGPLQLCVWTYIGAFGPRSQAALPMISAAKACSSAGHAAFIAVSGSVFCDILAGRTNSQQALADTHAASQSMLGLSMIGAPLLSVFLRSKFGPRGPFVVSAFFGSVCFLRLIFSLQETLGLEDRERFKIRTLNPLASATILFRQAWPVSVLATTFSLVSLCRCVDPYLQPFLAARLGHGHGEVARLLSFWGLTIFLGNQLLKKALHLFSLKSAILWGTLFNAADFGMRAMTTRWWHHPLGCILGLPGAGVEVELKAVMSSACEDQCPHLGRGTVQAALKTQQTLTIALMGSPLFGRAFSWWSRKAQRSSSPPVAAHYVLAVMAALSAHILARVCLPRFPKAQRRGSGNRRDFKKHESPGLRPQAPGPKEANQ